MACIDILLLRKLSFVLWTCFIFVCKGKEAHEDGSINNTALATENINTEEHLAISEKCPLKCNCFLIKSRNSYGVNCVRGRQSLPLSAPTLTLWFKYTHNTLPNNTLTRDSILSFANVTTLNLSTNRIRYIQKKSFTSIKFLTAIYLDNNPIIRPENYGCLVPLYSTLSTVSLVNVLPDKSPSSSLWKFLSSKSLQKIRCKENNQSVFNSGFQNLKTLLLSRNHLDHINFSVLENTNSLSMLANIDLSENLLTQEDIFQILKLVVNRRFFYTISEKIDQKTKETFYNKTISAKHKSDNTIQLDFSSNRITVVNSSMLNFLISLRLANTTNTSLKIQNMEIKLFLKSNPFSCTCSVVSLLDFLLHKSFAEAIADWKYLECESPKKVSGLRLSRLNSFSDRLKICDEKFHPNVKQLVFIIVFSLMLSCVSLLVAYLNRHKLMFYCNWIRNCGKEEERQTTVRWRNNIDKYSIPRDHKGVGHPVYHRDNQAVALTRKS